jgi:hypothetical protein
MTAMRQPLSDQEPGVSVRLRGDTPGSRELLEALRRENDQLRTALTTRIVIEQAKGMLAERLAVEVDEAFDRLRREARNRRIKLHTIAAAVVTREAWTGPLFSHEPTGQRGTWEGSGGTRRRRGARRDG